MRAFPTRASLHRTWQRAAAQQEAVHVFAFGPVHIHRRDYDLCTPLRAWRHVIATLPDGSKAKRHVTRVLAKRVGSRCKA